MDSLKELKSRLAEELFIEQESEKTDSEALDIDYEIDYSELKTQLDKSVPNINWTIPKVRATFKIIKKFVGSKNPDNKSE
jgi:hypothetical protein